MTPFQTYGQTSAPSNMMFPTAAYLQAAGNAADMQMKGMAALGSGIAQGISSAVSEYSKHKDDQAKFDATKKAFNAFSDYLSEDQKQGIKQIFDDTSMSVRQKNQLAPVLLNFLAQSQQQAGRESVANIMAGSRVQAAEARRPTPNTEATFRVPSLNDIFGLPADGSQGNPVPFQQPAPAMPQSGQPASRIGPNGQMEVWSSRLGRYVELDNPMQDIQY